MIKALRKHSEISEQERLAVIDRFSNFLPSQCTVEVIECQNTQTEEIFFTLVINGSRQLKLTQDTINKLGA